MGKMKYLTLLFSSFILLSCVYNHTDNIKDLGDNYYYLGDGNESQILFNLKKDGKSKVGKIIIPPVLLQYKFNDQYIIARSKNETEVVVYWIIDKTTQGKESVPMDSITFYQVLSEKEIDLKF